MKEGKFNKLSLKAFLLCMLAGVFVVAACVIAYAALSEKPVLQINVTDRGGEQHTIMSWFYDDETGQYYDENGKSLEELGLVDSNCTKDNPYYYSGIWKEANKSVAYATAISAVKVSDLLSYCSKVDVYASEILSTNSSSVELRFKGSELVGTSSTAWDVYGGIDEWSKTRYYNKDSYINAKAGVEVPSVLALKSKLEKNVETPPSATDATDTGIRLLQGQLDTVKNLDTAVEYRNMTMWADKSLLHRNEGTCSNVSVIEITPTYYPVRAVGGKVVDDTKEGKDGYASKVVGATVTPDDHYFSSLADLSYGFNVELENTYELHSVYFNGIQIQAESVTDNIYHFTVKAEAIDTGNKIVVNTRRNNGEQGTLYLDDVEGGTLTVKSGGVTLSNGSAIEEGMTLEFSYKLNEGFAFSSYTVNGQLLSDDSYVVTAADVAAQTSLHVGMKLDAKKLVLHFEKEPANIAGLSGLVSTDCEYYVTYTDPGTKETVQVNDGDSVSVGTQLNLDVKAPKGYFPSNLQLKYFKDSKVYAKFVTPLSMPDSAKGLERYNRERIATYKVLAEDAEYDNAELYLRMSVFSQNFNVKNIIGETDQGCLKVYAKAGANQSSQFGENGTDTRQRTVSTSCDIQLSAVPESGYVVDYFYYKVSGSSELDGSEQEYKLDSNYSTDDFQANIKIDPAELDDKGNYWFVGCKFIESDAQQSVNFSQPQHGKISVTCSGASVESGSKLPVSSTLNFKTECDTGYILDSYEVKAVSSGGEQYICTVASGDAYDIKPGYDPITSKDVKQKGRAKASTYQLIQGFDSVEISPIFRERKAQTIKVISAADAHSGGFDYKLIRSGVAKNAQGEYEEVEKQVIFDSSKAAADSALDIEVYEGNTLSAEVTLLDDVYPQDVSQEFIDTYSVLFKSAEDKYGVSTITLTGSQTDVTLNINRDTQYITWENVADTSWYNGTDTEFTLNTPQQLAGFSVLVNEGNSFSGKKVMLGADLDMRGDVENYPRAYVSIGTKDNPFKGTFDGYNHSVTFYDRASTQGSRANSVLPNYGLFCYAKDANISNVIIKGIVKRYYTTTADARGCGGIVGNMDGGSISNCKNEAEIASSMNNAGGIVGAIIGGQTKISKCINKGKVYYYVKTSSSGPAQQNYGGIVGSISDANKNVFDNCVNYGDVMYCGSYAGGICGCIEDKGSIDGASFINCYSTGSIYGGSGIGGILGNVRAYSSRTSIDGVSGIEINSCYFSGNITSGNPDQGGEFIGGVYGKDGLKIPIQINKSYYLKDNGSYVTYWVDGTTAKTDYGPITSAASETSDYATWIVPSVSEAQCSLELLKTKAADLGSAYTTDIYGVNNECNNTPILIWQNPGESSVFCQACKNGKISVAKDVYSEDETVSVDVEPSSGYRMSSIKAVDYSGKEVTLTCVQQGARYSFEMPKSTVILSAEFEKIYYISLGEDIENGTLEPQVTDAIAGQEVKVKVKPKQYCVLETIECVSADAQDIELTTIEDGIEYSFVMPQSDVTLAATFEKAFSVIIKKVENGSISVNRTGAREGNTICITPVPDAGYVLDSLKIVDMQNNKYTAQKQEDGTYTFDMPGASVQITPSFVKVQTKPVVNISVGKAKLKNAKSKAKGKLALKWKKLVGISGYQIYYKCKGGAAKYKKASASSKAKVLKKLKRGKKYKVKLRAFKVYEGKTYWGKWSNAKSVKVKKK